MSVKLFHSENCILFCFLFRSSLEKKKNRQKHGLQTENSHLFSKERGISLKA